MLENKSSIFSNLMIKCENLDSGNNSEVNLDFIR